MGYYIYYTPRGRGRYIPPLSLMLFMPLYAFMRAYLCINDYIGFVICAPFMASFRYSWVSLGLLGGVCREIKCFSPLNGVYSLLYLSLIDTMPATLVGFFDILYYYARGLVFLDNYVNHFYIS